MLEAALLNLSAWLTVVAHVGRLDASTKRYLAAKKLAVWSGHCGRFFLSFSLFILSSEWQPKNSFLLELLDVFLAR